MSRTYHLKKVPIMHWIRIQKFLRLCPLLFAFLLIACGTTGSQSVADQGTILLWHEWSGTEQEALDRLLEKFTEVTGFDVISIAYAPGTLENEFIDKALKGLGPDLVIGKQAWLPRLVDARAIRGPEFDGYDPKTFLHAALEILHHEEQLYALPLALHTTALYYNRATVDLPPQNLQTLVRQAGAGKRVAINSRFDAAYWGIRAFGGQTIDADGQVVLHHGGFAHWLDWLIDVHNNEPNVILGNDVALLRSLFTTGEVSYYVGSSTELLGLQEEMGKEAVGVALLPDGPNDVAGPLLEVEPIFYSAIASVAQHKRALLLTEFLTNIEHQKILGQEAGRIPANPHARIDRRVSPAIEAFVEQSHRARPHKLIPQMTDIIEIGHKYYAEALEGLIDGTEAANALTEKVNLKYGYDSVPFLEDSEETACVDSASLEIWLSWSQADTDALREVANAFSEYCPSVTIELTNHEEDGLLPHYQHAVEQGIGPDLLLTTSDQVRFLVAEDMAKKISTEHVDPQFLQRFIPTVPETMRHDGHLYGMPIVVDTSVLYYKSQSIVEAPVDLDQFQTLIDPRHKLVLTIRPYHKLHWGISAFGGRLFDLAGEPALSEGSFAEWLEWLQEVIEDGNVIIVKDQNEAQTLFENDDSVAFFVGEQHALHHLQTNLGNERLGVATLPGGPSGDSRPLLSVQGFVLNPRSQNPALAIKFAKHTVSVENQRQLALATHRIPANDHVDVSMAYPSISAFMQQVKTAVAPDDKVEMDAILGIGDIIFERVIEQDIDPQIVLDSFTTFLKSEYRKPKAAIPCVDEGRLVLWHSTHAEERDALTAIVAKYERACPHVEIATIFVDPALLPDRLAKVSIGQESDPTRADVDSGGSDIAREQEIAETVPHLILAPHDLVVPLGKAQLLKPVTLWVDEATLIPYHSYVVDAMLYEEELYGLPYTFKTPALLYNTQLVQQPATTIDEMFSSASAHERVALDTSFAGAFWGAAAFRETEDTPAFGHGGHLKSTPSFLGNSHSNPYINSGLTEWLTYLQEKQEQVGIVMSEDQDKLHDLFATGHAAYLVADPHTLFFLREELDEADTIVSSVGVATLPSGHNGPARPFLEVDGFLFSKAVSDAETQFALNFAKFATSSQSQRLLSKIAHLAPGNAMAAIHVDDPALNRFIAQAESSIPLPPRTDGYVLEKYGDELYENVLKNHEPPIDAVAHFTRSLNTAPPHQLVTTVGNTVIACEQSGELIFWHSWGFAQPPAQPQQESFSPGVAQQRSVTQEHNLLDQIIDEFHSHCPNVAVTPIYVPEHRLTAELAAVSADAGSDGRGSNLALPDLIVTNHERLATLASDGFIMPITSMVGSAITEQFSSETVRAVSFNDELYGLPHSIEVAALYYNNRLVEEPATTLEALLDSASAETRVAIESSFQSAFWGIGAFGGDLLKADGTLYPNQNGFINWLTWLQEAQGHPGFILSSDVKVLQQHFAEEDVAYLIAGPEALKPLRSALGDKVSVLHLPVGPQGSAEPLLTVNAFFLRKNNGPTKQLALTFAEFMTAEGNQTVLSRLTDLVPANLEAQEAVHDRAITRFIRQAKRAVLLPNVAWHELLSEAGDLAYSSVLEQEFDPESAIRNFQSALLK